MNVNEYALTRMINQLAYFLQENVDESSLSPTGVKKYRELMADYFFAKSEYEISGSLTHFVAARPLYKEE